MGIDALTKRQKQILDFIKSQTDKNGYPPTVREIGKALGLSSSATVHTHLSALEAKGYLHRDASKSRSLHIVGEHHPAESSNSAKGVIGVSGKDVVALPLVGRVAAGAPILAEQNITETLPLPIEIVGDSSSFLLRIKGESMIEAGILDGDYVVVKEQKSASNGEIVVAMIDDEATVKTFYREENGIRLQPENNSMEPIYPDTESLQVLGKVVALFRTV